MEEIYITPNGLELTESELRQEYGDRFDEFVAQGLLKKKSINQAVSPEGEVIAEEQSVTPEEEFSPGDLEVLEKDLVFGQNQTPTNEPPVETQEVVSETTEESFVIPEVLEEDPQTISADEIKKQREFLETQGVNVDAELRERKFGNKDTTGNEEGDINLIYNSYITTNASQDIVTDLESNLLKPLMRTEEVDVEVTPPSIDEKILEKLAIDAEDYAKWAAQSLREESASYKFLKEALPTEEGAQFEQEKKDSERVLSYKMEIMNNLRQDIATIDSRLQLVTDPKDKLKLLNIKGKLETSLIDQTKILGKMGELFPKFKEFTYDLDLERRKKIYNAGQKGGAVRVLTELGETAKTIPTTIADFALNTAAVVTSLLDQGIAAAGGDKKGVLAGITEMLLDSSQALDIEIGPVKRSGVTEGKPVTVGGNEYIVTEEGDVIDPITNVSMIGIISDDKLALIKERAKNVKFSETNFSGGSLLQGGVQTLANLFALIKGGQRFAKAAGVSPSVGMGLASYSSTAAQAVEDMKQDLINAGLTEKEALDKAAIAGNAIATLDGVFSALAGDNKKILFSLQGFRTAIINAVKKDGAKFTNDQLKQKAKDLAKENFKEVVIEELPVLFSEKGINALVNEVVDTEVRSSKVKDSEIIETIILTLGATTALGSKNLLTKNKRSDALRYVARNVNDLEGTIKKLVDNNNITEQEGKEVYDEIYAMQTAENRTKGTIVNSDNMLEVSDLLNQRQRLIDQKKDLEGPLAEEIDQKIADVDEQINQAKERDNEQNKIKDKVVPPKQADTDQTARGEIEVDNEFAEFSDQTIAFRDRETLTNKTGVEAEVGDRFVEKTVNDGIEKGQTTQEILDRITPRYGFDNSEIAALKEFIEGKKAGKIKNDFGTYRKGKPKTEQEVETIEETYTLPTDPVEARKDFEVLDNRDRAQGLEIEEDGAGKWVVRNKKTGRIVYSKTKKDAEFLATKDGSANWDYGEGDVIEVETTETETESEEEVVIEEGKPLTVNENKTLFKSIRDPKTPLETRRKAFVDIINKIKTKGKVAARRAKSLIKEVEKLNYKNPVTVEKTIQKITKTFDKANNVEALSVANKTKKQIKKAASNKNLDANVSTAAKEFLRIDPLTVDDLAQYQQKAEELLQGLRSTRRTKTGVKVAPAVDIKSTEEYSAKEIEAQDKRQAQLEADAFEALTGVPPADLSLSEVRDIIYNEETTEEAKKTKAEKKSKVIFDALKNAFSVYTSVVDEQLKTKTDPFKRDLDTGEKIEITADQKRIVRAFMNMDLNVLTDQEALQALDSLINFATNASTGGMEAVVSNYVGRTNLVKAIKDGLKGISLNAAGNFWSSNIASVPLMLEMIFKGQSRAAKILSLSGFQDVVNGAAKAETQTRQIEENYVKKFDKSKPNGEAFNTSLNMIERGMFAFMRRTLVGTEAEQQQEFERKKALILESIEKLKATNNKTDNEKADFYQEVFDKILKDSNNVTDVESKVDKKNIEAVEWMTEEWKKHYKDLSNTNLNIYNKKLDQDINYTPDVFSLLEPDTSQQKIDEPMFDTSGRRIYNKETGVLKKSKRPKSLDERRYVNLSFDTANINSLRKALTDVNTAAAIQQVKGFTESGDFDKLIPKKADRDIVYNRMKEYIAKKRGLEYTPQATKTILKYFNTLTSLGVSRTLGSMGQFIKQLTPLFNTMVNAGGVNTIDGIRLFTNPTVITWLKNSGYDIANRGISASANLESLSRKVDEAANSKPEKLRRGFQNVQNWWIDKFLVTPDKIAANASWMAYYAKDMKKQGIDITAPGFDWENHKVNKKAGDYAQQQVDRQQNISDRDLQGKLFSSNNPWVTITRQVLLPFSNFLLNQKARMYSDGRTLVSKTAAKEDKAKALRSLGGLVVETGIFNYLGLMLTQATAAASNYLMGEDDEEQAAKDLENRLKGRLQNVILDVSNPAPPADDLLIRAINGGIKMIDDDEDPFQFFESNKKLIEDLGLISISLDKIFELYDFANVMATGEYKKENAFGGSKTHQLSTDEKKAAQYSTLLLFLYTIGALPAEAGSIARYNMRTIKRKVSKAPKYLNAKDQARLKRTNRRRWEQEYGPKSFYARDKKRKAEERKRRK
tara:strand:+ start:7373 stop:13702 length:6330 start_codon:yes stop_codon:yes gene_type:complete